MLHMSGCCCVENLVLVLFFSITQTPEWISSLDTHDQMLPPRAQTPNLPTPPELAALLQSHLQNIQQQQLIPSAMNIPHPHLPGASQIPASVRPLPKFQEAMNIPHPHHPEASQIPSVRPLPQFQEANQISHTSRGQSSSPPRNRTTNQKQQEISQIHTTPPRPKPGKSFPVGMSYAGGSQSEPNIDSSDKKSLQGFSPIYGEFGRGAAWDGSRAVPIRPPQQGEDPYHKEDEQTVHLSKYICIQ